VSDLAQALMVAIRVHADQRDKQGEPYLLHVLRVVEAVTYDTRVVAALHDVLEDGTPSVEHLRPVGLSEDEWIALEALTRKPDRWSYREYIDQIAGHAGSGGDIAREVKLADLRDNLGRIPGPDLLLSFAPVERDAVAAKWASLKARYEKAIDTLERVA